MINLIVSIHFKIDMIKKITQFKRNDEKKKFCFPLQMRKRVALLEITLYRVDAVGTMRIIVRQLCATFQLV